MIHLAPNNLYGLALDNPLIIASGCCGFGGERGKRADLAAPGALVTASISLRPRRPGPAPRLIETPAGLLWVAGLPNPGAEAVLRRYAPAWAALDTRLVVSLTGTRPEEFVALAEGLEGVEGVAGLELRLPPEAALAIQILRRTRQASRLPLLARLPALETGLPELARAIVAAGADAIVLPGSRPGLALLPDGRQQPGLLCGPALRPLALRQLSELAGQLDAPIVAGGGIASTDDARDFLRVGATAVQIGSMAMVDPTLPQRIAQELA
jgi:dihydroorotate dehydrogenase (NAD+) catalytic subunit